MLVEVLCGGLSTTGIILKQLQGKTFLARAAPHLTVHFLHLLRCVPVAGKPRGHAGIGGSGPFYVRSRRADIHGALRLTGGGFRVGTPTPPSVDLARWFPGTQDVHHARLGTSPCPCHGGGRRSCTGSRRCAFSTTELASSVQGHDKDIPIYRLAYHLL